MVLILVELLQTIELQGKSLKGPHRTPVRMYGTLNTPWKNKIKNYLVLDKRSLVICQIKYNAQH